MVVSQEMPKATSILTTEVSMSDNERHDHTPTEERHIREAALDETIAGSFPASDPPSSLPNPDEHDAEGSGVVPDASPRPAPEGPRSAD